MKNYKPLRQPDGTAEGILAGGASRPGMDTHDDKTSLSLRVNRSLKLGFKSRAAGLGRTMEDCLDEALRNWMDK